MAISHKINIMAKGFMMKSSAFKVTSTQTSDSQQEAMTYGQSNGVVKPSKTDEIPGNHKGHFFSK